MATLTPAALKAEIDTDPESLGYKVGAAWKTHPVLLELLNTHDQSTVTRRTVRAEELRPVFDREEFAALQQGDRDWLMMHVLGGDIDMSKGPVLGGLQQLFNAASKTRIAALLVVQRTGSRAEVLWGEGTIVTGRHLSEAGV